MTAALYMSRLEQRIHVRIYESRATAFGEGRQARVAKGIPIHSPVSVN